MSGKATTSGKPVVSIPESAILAAPGSYGSVRRHSGRLSSTGKRIFYQKFHEIPPDDRHQERCCGMRAQDVFPSRRRASPSSGSSQPSKRSQPRGEQQSSVTEFYELRNPLEVIEEKYIFGDFVKQCDFGGESCGVVVLLGKWSVVGVGEGRGYGVAPK